MSTRSINTSAVYRHNHYGHFRDMLEQRQYGRLKIEKEINGKFEKLNTTAILVKSTEVKDVNENIHNISTSPFIDETGIEATNETPTGGPYKPEPIKKALKRKQEAKGTSVKPGTVINLSDTSKKK